MIVFCVFASEELIFIKLKCFKHIERERERESSFRLVSVLCSKFHEHKMAKSVDTNLPLSNYKNPKESIKGS